MAKKLKIVSIEVKRSPDGPRPDCRTSLNYECTPEEKRMAVLLAFSSVWRVAGDFNLTGVFCELARGAIEAEAELKAKKGGA